jgi:quercetin dioxygenase-like cupin family protein
MKRSVCGFLLVLFLAGHLCAGEASPYESAVLAKTSSSWNGRDLPDYPDGKPEVTILRIIIPPGTELPIHKHPVINAGVLWKGQLTVVTEAGERLHLRAGDAIVEVVNTWHYGKNEGDEPAELIVFYAGVQGTPLSVLKVRTSPPDSP